MCTTTRKRQRECKHNLLLKNKLWQKDKNGGGGIRTPVPRHFRTSFYMLSRSIKVSLRRPPNDRLPSQLFRNQIRSYVPNTRKNYPTVRRPCQAHRKNPAGRAALFTQPFATGSCQLHLCRMISQANRRPGHATCPSTCPVEAVRPHINFSKSHFYNIIPHATLNRKNSLRKSWRHRKKCTAMNFVRAGCP